MPDYRRARIAGGTYFFTVNLLSRQDDALVRHQVLRKISQQGRGFVCAFQYLESLHQAIGAFPLYDLLQTLGSTFALAERELDTKDVG
jgi:hypothetical protein